jgi:hypothetical protein
LLHMCISMGIYETRDLCIVFGYAGSGWYGQSLFKRQEPAKANLSHSFRKCPNELVHNLFRVAGVLQWDRRVGVLISEFSALAGMVAAFKDHTQFLNSLTSVT